MSGCRELNPDHVPVNFDCHHGRAAENRTRAIPTPRVRTTIIRQPDYDDNDENYKFSKIPVGVKTFTPTPKGIKAKVLVDREGPFRETRCRPESPPDCRYPTARIYIVPKFIKAIWIAL